MKWKILKFCIHVILPHTEYEKKLHTFFSIKICSNIFLSFVEYVIYLQLNFNSEIINIFILASKLLYKYLN